MGMGSSCFLSKYQRETMDSTHKASLENLGWKKKCIVYNCTKSIEKFYYTSPTELNGSC